MKTALACIYADRDGCGPARPYICGPRCDTHSPAAVAGRTVPVPDPALTMEGLRAQAAAASHPDVVNRQHLIDTAVAAIRHVPVPTRDQTAAKVGRSLPPPTATQQRDTAMAQVDRAANAEWKDAARRAIWHLATTREEFTADDVWMRLAEMGVPTTVDPRALGPVIMRALRAGAIRDTGRMDKSERRHKTKITVYERNPQ